MPASKKYLCRATVHRNGKEWACPYKARRDGYCNWHHPDEVERRRMERLTSRPCTGETKYEG